MHVLINDAILNLKIRNKTGPGIHTNIRTCQGDRLLVLLFILYLFFAVKPLPPVISTLGYHKPLCSALDWIIDQDIHKITTDPKYADDISFLRSDKSEINQVERERQLLFFTEGLYVNESKIERYQIQRGAEDAWKKCKYFGSLLDTEEDIKRQKRTYN